MRKTSALRELLKSPRIIMVAGAHDVISSRLIERAGFDAIWTSGFGISAAQLGLVDAGLLTMTEHLEATKRINDAVSLPVIADCDTGYGNAINVIRTVREYEKEGIAGICIEDNIFPKRCSFYPGVRRELVSIEEQVGKIRAAKAAQRDPDFLLIARTEALIAGWGMGEAVKRGLAYKEAGADMVLIHSKSSSPDEVREFARSWPGGCPLAVVPTRFPTVTAQELDGWGFKMVIFANQALRSSLRAMEETLNLLRQKGQASLVEDRIAPLEMVYDLVGLDELRMNEGQFLPVGGEKTRVIIVAAGFEEELMPLIEERPKAMLDIKGKTILERQIMVFNECNIKDIVVVRGYHKEKITLPNIRYYDNDNFRETGELASLFVAEAELAGRVIFAYSDIIFDKSILEKLLKSSADIALVIDRAWCDQRTRPSRQTPSRPDLVVMKTPPAQGYRFLPSLDDNSVIKIGQRIPPDEAHGEFIGLAMLSEKGCESLREIYKKVIARHRTGPFHEAASIQKAAFTDILQEIIDQGHRVSCVSVYKGWMEVDTFDDYRRAWAAL